MTIETVADQITIGAGVLALVFLLPAFLLRRRLRWLPLIFAPFILVFGVGSSIAFWYNHRPLPANEQRMRFEGIEYIREVRPGEDDPKVVHVVRIDLDTPGLSFLTTPHTPTDGYDQKARTTSQFAAEFGVQLAINADAFRPWWENGPFDYYPHEGDPVNIFGMAASRGDLYTRGYAQAPTPNVHISADNVVTINDVPEHPYNVVSGFHTLLIDGVKQQWGSGEYMEQRHPRTAIALDRIRRTLMFIVVDGRQPNYSEGATLDELTNILLDFGAWSAVDMDGGGSSTLVMADSQGNPLTLNSPIHTRIPGRERPIANHLGVFAPPLSH